MKFIVFHIRYVSVYQIPLKVLKLGGLQFLSIVKNYCFNWIIFPSSLIFPPRILDSLLHVCVLEKRDKVKHLNSGVLAPKASKNF